MKVRITLVVALALAIGLLVQANLGAAAKKKKDPEASKELVVNGELTDQDGKDTVLTNSYCKTFKYKMVKGRTYQIDMKSKDVDSYLRLEDPNGKEVAKDDDGGGFPDAKIVYTADETGEFKIIATTFGGNSTGKFTLTARDKNAVGAGNLIKLDKGEATYNGSVTKDDPAYKGKKHKLVTIALEEGKTYQIDMITKSDKFDPYLVLESPGGEVLAMDDDGGGFPNARITHKAAKSGVYRIICTNFGGSLGEFTLTVREEK